MYLFLTKFPSVSRNNNNSLEKNLDNNNKDVSPLLVSVSSAPDGPQRVNGI